jgi:hypothetical protein
VPFTITDHALKELCTELSGTSVAAVVSANGESFREMTSRPPSSGCATRCSISGCSSACGLAASCAIAVPSFQ